MASVGLDMVFRCSAKMVGRPFLSEFLFVPLVGATANLTSIYATNDVGAMIWKALDGTRNGHEVVNQSHRSLRGFCRPGCKRLSRFRGPIVFGVGGRVVLNPMKRFLGWRGLVRNRVASCLLLLSGVVVNAGTFGVPTALDADGTVSAASVNPPGWLEVFGTNAAAALGDVVHEQRFYVEVTGTTLDIRIFDPGRGPTARDFNTANAAADQTTMTFQLVNPAGVGGTLFSLPSDVDTGANQTDNRLVRLAPSGFQTLDSTSVQNTNFSGLTPGVYQFRVVATGGTQGNVYGVDFRVSKANQAHYNVYVLGQSAPLSGFLTGANINTTAPGAGITGPISVFPWVNRGCSMQSSNYDGDLTASASVIDALGAATAVPLSADSARVEGTQTIETTTAQNTQIDNYGLWELRFDPGTANGIDWRFADFSLWSNNPAAPSLRNPNNGIRMYLPNGYTPTAGANGAVKPQKPVLRLGAAVLSGPNPPVVGSLTRFVLTASLKNSTALALSNAQITVGLPTGVTYGGVQTCLVNGTVSPCTDASAAGFRKVTVASLAASQTLSLRFEVTVSPTAAGLLPVTGAPVAGATPPNSTTWASYTQFNTAETLGPLCQMQVNVGGTTKVATAAHLHSAAFDAATRTLQFRTSYQSGTRGFEVKTFGDETASGVLLDTLVAPNPDTVTPELYQLTLRGKVSTFIAIDEIDLDANRTRIATLEVAKLPAALAVLSIKGAGVSSEPKDTRTVASFSKHAYTSKNEMLRVGVEAGLNSVSRAELVRVGLPRETLDVDLAHHGERVESHWSEDQTRLVFLVPPNFSRYASSDAVLMTWGNRSAIAPSVALSSFSSPKPATMTVVERNAVYVPSSAFNVDPWWWALLRSGVSWPASAEADKGRFDLPGVSQHSQNVSVRLFVTGRTRHWHQVSFAINGASVAVNSMQGQDETVVAGEIDARVLKEKDNQLTVSLVSSATPEAPDSQGLAYLSHLEFDLEPAVAPTVHAVTSIRPLKPFTIKAADYLILTHPRFLEAAQALASVKEAQGFRTQVVDVEAAYDALSAGVVEANAVAEVIRRVAALGPLRFVLLLGDDTFDPKDYTQRHAESLVPSLDAIDQGFGRIPSDARYADLDGDEKPDIAIGRLPVQTMSEALGYVEKVRRASNRFFLPHTFVSDSSRAGAENFQYWAQTALPSIPGRQVHLDNGLQPARAELVRAFGQDVGVLHYFGHGSPTGWSSQQQLFTSEDANALTSAPGSVGAVVFQWGCLSQWYQYLFGPSLAESMLLVPQGGALVSVGPVGISTPEAQASFRTRLYRRFFGERLPIGDALRRTQSEMVGLSADLHDVALGFTVLGDPSFQFEPTSRQVDSSMFREVFSGSGSTMAPP